MRNKGPLLFAGVVGAVVGAMVMWLLTREAGEPQFENTVAEQETATVKRIGIPRRDPADREIEAAAKGAEKVDPQLLTQLATATDHPGQMVLFAGSSDAGGSGNVAALPRFADAPRPRSEPVERQMRTITRRPTGNPSADDALAVALEAATPYQNEGFAIRDDYWTGTFSHSYKSGLVRAIKHQLFRGNEYWFFGGTEDEIFALEIHVFDSAGNLAESEDWQRRNSAGARVIPTNSGVHYIVVSQRPGKSQTRRTVHWAVVYGYK